MPVKKKKNIPDRTTQTKLPYTVSKRQKDESFEVSPNKRLKNHVVISDSDESSSTKSGDDDEASQTGSANNSFTTARSDTSDDDSDTGSCIVVDSQFVAATVEDNAKRAKLDKQFKELPTEVHQHIAKFLTSDADVTRYSRVCKATYARMDDSVWRYRFLERFDAVPNASGTLLREKYRFRGGTTNLYTKFAFDEYKYLGNIYIKQVEQMQEKVLDMLQNLIIESNAHKGRDENGDEVIVSRNLTYIRDYVSPVPGTPHTGNISDIIDSIARTKNNWDLQKISSVDSDVDANTRLLLIQLCLTSISWDPRYCTKTIVQFDRSQLEAYASPAKQPLFLGKWKGDLNVRWCLNVANFFKFHLKAGNGEGLLAHAYAALHPTQLPQPWLGRLKSGTQQLGSHWKGAYFFMNGDDLERMREHGEYAEDGHYSDELDGGESFQDISLFFDDQKLGKQNWPKSWESALQSDPFSNVVPEPNHRHGSRRTTRSSRSRKDHKKPKDNANPGVKYFYGSSHDSSSNAHLYGAVHGIPPQHGIPGFQRMTVIKFFPDEIGNYDPTQAWGYEGCVLPGGRIVIGRWFDARSSSDQDVMSGPFIFWNVDQSEADAPIDGKKALEFFKLMKLHGHC